MEPRFLADAMLGRLARWLRITGHDTRFDARLDDAALVELARREGRVLLTRDRLLVGERRPGRCLLISSNVPLEQLQEVCRAFELDWRPRLFTRCPRCNAPVHEVARDAARGRVPEAVLAGHESFRRCGGCGRLYWDGSHTRRMRETLVRHCPRPD